jgi:hypothetical protein
MRKLIVAAASAATLATVGLAATAQAQPTSHGAGVGTTASLSKVAVTGIPTGFQVNAPSTAAACTWTVTSSPALPKSVTTGVGGPTTAPS